jgi:hypothetical protein
MTHLVIYSFSMPAKEAEKNFKGSFAVISHRDAQYFDTPKSCATHFAIMCDEGKDAQKIRDAYKAAGKQEAMAPAKPAPVAPVPAPSLAAKKVGAKAHGTNSNNRG